MLYDRTLIQIRERSFLDLLDLSLYVIRARPVVLGRAGPARNRTLGRRSTTGCSPIRLPDIWSGSLLLVLEVPWATAPLTLVLGDLMFGMPAQAAPRSSRRCS